MDSLVTSAARALAAGDPLGALKRVALREDAPALALRGIAMAQLGDLPRARILLRKAEQSFGPREALARARCIVAAAEIALVSRDLNFSSRTLDAARALLDAQGDRINAAHARHLEIRRLVLIGRLGEAARKLETLDPAALPPPLRAAHELCIAGMAMRRLDTSLARTALDRAAGAARQAGIPALMAEVEAAAIALRMPAARLIAKRRERYLRLDEVESLLAGDALLIDATHHAVRQGGKVVPLASRPVLFAIARALAEAWPGDVPREALIAGTFRARHADDSHRQRLRVEIGRLRKALAGLAAVNATQRGFILVPGGGREAVVLAPPADGEHGEIMAFLADGESWSSSALALALGASQRTVQRALEDLSAAGRVQSVGHGRTRRWMTPPAAGITTTLLLPPFIPGS